MYVRLHSLNLASNTWASNDYTYTGGGSGSGSFVAAAITSPSPGSVLSRSTAMFQCSAGTGTPSAYWLRLARPALAVTTFPLPVLFAIAVVCLALFRLAYNSEQVAFTREDQLSR